MIIEPPPRCAAAAAAVPYPPSSITGGTGARTVASMAILWCDAVARFTAVSNPVLSARIFSTVHH